MTDLSAAGDDAARLSHALWDDTDVFDRGHEKAAASLAAAARVLARRLPLGGRERGFLALYERVRDADPDAFTHVWTWPTAHAWSRDTYELVGAALDGTAYPRRDLAAEAVPRALSEMLDGFGGFAAAILLAAGEDVAFEAPVPVRLPFSIPGAGRLLWPEGEAARAEILGVRGGELDVRAAVPLRLRAAPLARHGGFELPLDPFGLRCVGEPLEHVEAAIGGGLDYHEASAGLVGDGLARIARHAPGAFAQMCHLFRCIAVRPGSDDGEASSVSFSDLPGACVASLVANPLEVGDTLLHELHHNRLFSIEEDGPAFPRGAGGPDDHLHYSPWRPDPRPLRGLFHALYVFQPVGRYWIDVLVSDDAEVGDESRAYAADSLARACIRTEITLRLLEREATLTPRGEAFLGELGRSTRALQEAAADLGVSGALPAWVCMSDGSLEREGSAAGGHPISVWESLREHIERHDRAKECADFLSELALL